MSSDQTTPVPYGYCKCGCGEKTKLAKQNSTTLNWVKGEPQHYILGHGGKRHGHGGKTPSPTYRTWASMIGRCTQPTVRGFHRYGGRGITVCERWRRFENFLADMGERPEDKTIDRIDPDGNYEPGNCRWATRKEQEANKRPGLRQRRKLERWRKIVAMREEGLTNVEIARELPSTPAGIAAEIKRMRVSGVSVPPSPHYLVGRLEAA